VPDEPAGPEAALPPSDIVVRFDQPAARVRTYPVRQPEDDRAEFIVEVHASVLKRCRVRLQALRATRFPAAELLLAVSMLGIGATASALSSSVPLASPRGVLFFTIAPAISIGALVAYFFLRQKVTRELTPLIDEVLSDLPDPDRTQ